MNSDESDNTVCRHDIVHIRLQAFDGRTLPMLLLCRRDRRTLI